MPYKSRVLRIRFRAQVSTGVYTYTLQDPDTGRNVAHNVRHAELLEELLPYAEYSVGDQVVLARGNQLTILKRHWDFRKGTVWYLVVWRGGPEAGRWITQERMLEVDQEREGVWRR